jgi:methyl-accepting chemotaxis protein
MLFATLKESIFLSLLWSLIILIAFFIQASPGYLLLLLSGAILSIGLVAFLSINKKNEEEKLLEYLKRGALGDYLVMEKAVTLGTQIASSILSTISAGRHSRSEAMQLVRDAAGNNPEFIGVSLIFEPNAFDGQDDRHKNQDWHDASGRFYPYFYRGADGNVSIEGLPGCDDEDYYRIPKTAKKTSIIKPFHFDIDGVPVLMTTVAVPIVQKNKFIGMVGFDIELKDVKEIYAEVVLHSNPFQRLTTAELENRLLSDRAGTAGILSKAIKATSSNQKSILQRLLSTSAQVSQTSAGLRSGSEESTVASGEVARTIGELAKSASDQASNTQHGAAIAAQLSDLIEDVQTLLSRLNQATQTVERMRNEGSVVVEELINKTNQRESFTEKIQEGIEKTNTSADKINSASQVIQTIADQTNLLALNAAIEAARAGDAGRGFAVVADEIRKLAEQSSTSAQEIDSTVKELQINSQDSVQIMQKSTQIAGEQANSVKMTNEKFAGIAEAIAETEEVIAIINTSGQRMRDEKNRIIDIFANLSAIAEENAAASQEVSATTQQLAASMETISGESRNLAVMAQDLQEAIDKFA